MGESILAYIGSVGTWVWAAVGVLLTVVEVGRLKHNKWIERYAAKLPLLWIFAIVFVMGNLMVFHEVRVERDVALQMLNKPISQPILAGPRPIETRIVSSYPEFPFGLEVVVQTDKTFEPPFTINLVFDGNVGRGQVQFYWIRTGSITGYIDPTRSNVFVAEIDHPAITAKTPVVFAIYSQSAIKVERLEIQ